MNDVPLMLPLHNKNSFKLQTEVSLTKVYFVDGVGIEK